MLLQQLHTHVSSLNKQLASAPEEVDSLELLMSTIQPAPGTVSGNLGPSKGAMGAITAVTTDARLVLGTPLEGVAGTDFPFFNLCDNNNALLSRAAVHDIRTMSAPSKVFQPQMTKTTCSW